MNKLEKGKVNVVKYWMERERLLREYVDYVQKAESLHKAYIEYCDKGQRELINKEEVYFYLYDETPVYRSECHKIFLDYNLEECQISPDGSFYITEGLSVDYKTGELKESDY